MNNLFNLDNGVFYFLGKVWDIFIISIIWSLLVLPVITIGPATTALYYTVVKVIRRERGYLLKEYFRSFKSNFFSGLILGVILMFVYMILYVDINFAKSLDSSVLSVVFLIIFTAFSFLIICGTVYVFPLLSRFSMGVLPILKTSLFMSMKHLPSTFLMLFIVGIFAFVIWIQPILLFFSSGILFLLLSFTLEKIFKIYIPKPEDGENSNVDQWYLE